MYTYPKEYDVIVIGAGHAGCEAALATSRMGLKTCLLTMNLDTTAKMSCNPAIGGIGKGHIVREIDALGGEMARIIDSTGINFRVLNTKKGPAVWSLRAQADKKDYAITMKKVLEKQEGLDIKQQMAEEILVENYGNKKRACGVFTRARVIFKGKAIIITPGTFLNGLIHIGEISYSAGRADEEPSQGLSHSLSALGFEMGRLKTGTPPRINANTIDFKKLKAQYGDQPPVPFSYSTETISCKQVPCYITYTNRTTHKLILDNLHRSPLYTGRIVGTGPRYCPSIEDKVVRFPHAERHQIFLEPEGRDTEEIYLNGVSTSMPPDVQLSMLHTIEGLKRAEIMRFGYAIEYDFIFPTQLLKTLETKLIENLYLAGQINGTSGYEEAAGQGIVAGINAALKIKGEEPFILDRSNAYIGVLIDDLVTKGTTEPYRIFTSRAEHRLLLRHDNADIRLMEHGYKYGLISEERIKKFREKQRLIKETIEWLKSKRHGNDTLLSILKRPGVRLDDLPADGFNIAKLTPEAKACIEVEMKYEGYIKREMALVERLKRLECKRIPDGLEYGKIVGLRREAIEKLSKIRPLSIGQASRIPGVSPCDISILLIHIERAHH